MPLRDYLAPLRLPIRSRSDKYERNWQQLERTINAQTPVCYSATAQPNNGLAMTAGVTYYLTFGLPAAAVNDRWQMIDPVLLGGVTLDTDPPVVRVPWDGLWDLRLTWIIISGSAPNVKFTLDVGDYDVKGMAFTFTNLAVDSASFRDGVNNIVFNSIFLGVGLRANTILRFGMVSDQNISAGFAAVADQIFRWMCPYPNGEVVAQGQIPQGGTNF